VASKGLDQLLVGDLVHPGDSTRESSAALIWLTGFGGTSGMALVGPEVRMFATDFRYAERAEAEVPSSFQRLTAERQLVDELGPHLRGRVGFDPATTSVETHGKLAELIGDGTELVPEAELLAGLRRSKDETELQAIAEAARLTDEVYLSIEQTGLTGRSEREVAIAAEVRMRELGAEAVAFPPIVASGTNGALPHAEPTARAIEAGDLVTIDLGAIADGYASDCTRTLAAGKRPSDEAAAVYELVLEAQLAGLASLRAGAPARDVDAAARDVIVAGGHGEEFGHGLGHGVGIQVHEPPRLSKLSEDELCSGDVVTVEPGVYVAGRFGVRIEDLVVITEDGYENLSGRPKELQVVG
jgi:Xaa-Pro aminopeptidase